VVMMEKVEEEGGWAVGQSRLFLGKGGLFYWKGEKGGGEGGFDGRVGWKAGARCCGEEERRLKGKEPLTSSGEERGPGVGVSLKGGSRGVVPMKGIVGGGGGEGGGGRS